MGSSQARPILLSYVSDRGICYHTNQVLIASWGNWKCWLVLSMFLPLWDNFGDVFFFWELHANWESVTFGTYWKFSWQEFADRLKSCQSVIQVFFKAGPFAFGGRNSMQSVKWNWDSHGNLFYNHQLSLVKVWNICHSGSLRHCVCSSRTVSL
jgi:hypothetical protein